MKCLIDTGAVASCISEQFAKSLKLTPSPTLQGVKLVSANSQEIHSLGVTDIDLAIQGLVIPFSVHVLRSLSRLMILGNDFLRASSAIIDCAQRSISLFDGLVTASLTTYSDRASILRTAQDVVIPPMSEAIISLHVPPRYRRKTSLVETYEPIKNRFLMVARALIEPKSQYTICPVCIVGRVARKLKADTPLARIIPISGHEFDSLQILPLDVQNDQTSDMTQNEANLPLHEERLRILREKGLELNNDNLTPEQFKQLSALLYEFQEIFCSEYEKLPLSRFPPYHINLKSDKPVRQKRYPLSPHQEQLLERYADRLLAAGIIQKSTSPWNAPALLVKKSNKGGKLEDDPLAGYRLVIDYRKQNFLISDESHPVVEISSLVAQISQAQPKFFSSFDFLCSFYQCPLDEQSKAVTAWSTRTRRFEFNRAPMGKIFPLGISF